MDWQRRQGRYLTTAEIAASLSEETMKRGEGPCVFKIGRTTGHTSGRLHCIYPSVTVPHTIDQSKVEVKGQAIAICKHGSGAAFAMSGHWDVDTPDFTPPLPLVYIPQPFVPRPAQQASFEESEARSVAVKLEETDEDLFELWEIPEWPVATFKTFASCPEKKRHADRDCTYCTSKKCPTCIKSSGKGHQKKECPHNVSQKPRRHDVFFRISQQQRNSNNDSNSNNDDNANNGNQQHFAAPGNLLNRFQVQQGFIDNGAAIAQMHGSFHGNHAAVPGHTFGGQMHRLTRKKQMLKQRMRELLRPGQLGDADGTATNPSPPDVTPNILPSHQYRFVTQASVMSTRTWNIRKKVRVVAAMAYLYMPMTVAAHARAELYERLVQSITESLQKSMTSVEDDTVKAADFGNQTLATMVSRLEHLKKSVTADLATALKAVGELCSEARWAVWKEELDEDRGPQGLAYRYTHSMHEFGQKLASTCRTSTNG
ncbi:hypothetical protein CONLIGDRAFT_684965 [Coniochaeta ligniaria NRRL 30616]|uniref:Uncharacterized protein n=1 Tax=Coniochaeta ligniaria NRRL 30616 TaxID=1408157 RepID=A0A1J7J7F3_9PEZI|nr:hypothetical protein CONLIGDRAFT_684965 [Coniochaeta ligniaria NRRL 30616]